MLSRTTSAFSVDTVAMSAELANRIVRHLEASRAGMVELLEALVLRESPSEDVDSLRRMLRMLAEAFQQRGFRASTWGTKQGGGVLLAVPGSRRRGRPYQLIVGHCDTVWPVGTIETMPAKSEEGVFWGPGSYDMKAGLVQGLFAVQALAAVGVDDPPVTPVFLINSDEETGSRQSTRVISRLARRADRCLVLEPSLGPQGSLKTARKGVGRFTVTVRGKAAHAGLDPGQGASAILELSLVVQKLFALNDHQRGITVNVGTIDGGLRPNVIAPESRATVDVRVPTRDDAERIEARIRSIEPQTPGTQIEIRGRIGRPPMERTERNRRLWQLAQRCASQIGIEITEAAAGGGSDGNTTSQLAPTLDGLGAVGAGAHAVNEHLALDKMVERAALLACLLASPPLDVAVPPTSAEAP